MDRRNDFLMPDENQKNMKNYSPVHTFWHTFQKEQIKPQARGEFLYVLHTFGGLGHMVFRNILDPNDKEPDSPRNIQYRLEILHDSSHGIIYNGVNEEYIKKAIDLGPKHDKEDSTFYEYNKGLILNAAKTFLISNNHTFIKREMPSGIINLLTGSVYLLPPTVPVK